MGRTVVVKWFGVLMIMSSLLFSQEHHYKAYAPWETDSVFVAWLIKRHVDKDAIFSTVKKPEPIEKAFAINTSYSDMRRSARFTAFEAAVRIHGVQDACVDKLRPIIRVLEMTPWRKHEDMRSFRFEEGIVPLFPSENGQQSLEKVFVFIDKYCEEKE